jgi:Fe-S cluster assembly ATP-binding protein
MNGLAVKDLSASVGSFAIINKFEIEVPFGEIHAIMGPNGSGKSTLCHVLTGHPDFAVEGSATIDGVELLDKPIDERSRMGLLHAFQYPVEIPGIRLAELVRQAATERGLADAGFEGRMAEAAARFDMTRFLDRSINDDLSGGEKKRSEIFQMALLGPKIALLDEIDSGLDIDAVKQVAEAVETMRSPEVGVLMITHYSRILKFLAPDRIHVMIQGRIVESGGPELADELEAGGYDGIRRRLGIEVKAEAPQKRPADFFTETPFD